MHAVKFLHELLSTGLTTMPGCRLEVLRANTPGDLEVAIDPEELEGLDEAGVKALYNARLEEERARNKREDFSDMVAQHNAAAKRKAASKDAARQAKKPKETFKF